MLNFYTISVARVENGQKKYGEIRLYAETLQEAHNTIKEQLGADIAIGAVISEQREVTVSWQG